MTMNKTETLQRRIEIKRQLILLTEEEIREMEEILAWELQADQDRSWEKN